MEGLTKEDVLALRLEIAQMRREMAELRLEIAMRGISAAVPYAPVADAKKDEAVSVDQIITEWTEGEDAWKTKEKTT